MSFWFAAIIGLGFTIGMFYVEIFWMSIFKIKPPEVIVWGSIPILWIAETALLFFASDKIFTIDLCINFSLLLMTIFAHEIMKWIKKSKE